MFSSKQVVNARSDSTFFPSFPSLIVQSRLPCLSQPLHLDLLKTLETSHSSERCSSAVQRSRQERALPHGTSSSSPPYRALFRRREEHGYHQGKSQPSLPSSLFPLESRGRSERSRFKEAEEGEESFGFPLRFHALPSLSPSPPSTTHQHPENNSRKHPSECPTRPPSSTSLQPALPTTPGSQRDGGRWSMSFSFSRVSPASSIGEGATLKGTEETWALSRRYRQAVLRLSRRQRNRSSR